MLPVMFNRFLAQQETSYGVDEPTYPGTGLA